MSPCESDLTLHSIDSNGDGRLDIGDPVHALNFLFLGGLAPQVCLAGGNENLKARIAELEAELETSQAQLQTATTSLTNCQENLETTSAALTACQADLATTNTSLTACQGDLDTTSTALTACQSSSSVQMGMT